MSSSVGDIDKKTDVDIDKKTDVDVDTFDWTREKLEDLQRQKTNFREASEHPASCVQRTYADNIGIRRSRSRPTLTPCKKALERNVKTRVKIMNELTGNLWQIPTDLPSTKIPVSHEVAKFNMYDWNLGENIHVFAFEDRIKQVHYVKYHHHDEFHSLKTTRDGIDPELLTIDQMKTDPRCFRLIHKRKTNGRAYTMYPVSASDIPTDQRPAVAEERDSLVIVQGLRYAVQWDLIKDS